MPERKRDGNLIKFMEMRRALDFEVEGQRTKWRPKRT